MIEKFYNIYQICRHTMTYFSPTLTFENCTFYVKCKECIVTVELSMLVIINVGMIITLLFFNDHAKKSHLFYPN